MNLFSVFFAAFCCVAACAAPIRAGVEESEMSARLSAQGNDLLDQLLGPGRARVIVTVQGEKSELETESEVLTPIQKKTGEAAKILPGYVTEAEARLPLDYVQKDKEHSTRTSGFVVKSIQAAVVLDATVTKDQENAVRRVLPDFLHMSGDRGDVMTVLRAPLLEPWKRMTLTMDGMRTLAHLGGFGVLAVWASLVLGALALFLSVVAYIIAMRVVRTFVRELAARREHAAAGRPPAMPGGLPAAPPAGAVPDLGFGGVPTLSEEGEILGGPPRSAAALGRRFDFLSGRDPRDAGDMLSKEPPEDLALLFGYLADSNPDLSARLFAALPVALQGPVSEALVRLTMADPERLAMLENRLKSSVEFGVRGPDRLGRILSRLPAQEREEILGELMSKDRGGAEQVEKALFPFEDIAKLSPVELRRLLAAVPHQDWGVALRGAPPGLADRVLSQLPGGVREMVRDAAEIQQPREKVLEARSRILSQAYALAARGLLTAGREGASPELI